MTAEEQKAFEDTTKAALTDALSTTQCFTEAESAALEAIEKLFAPIVNAVDEKATVKVFISK